MADKRQKPLAEHVVPNECLGLGSDPCIAAKKRILYFAPSEKQCKTFIQDLSRSTVVKVLPDCLTHQFEFQETRLCWLTEHKINEVVKRLGEYYVSLLLIDIRWSAGKKINELVAGARALLAALDNAGNLEARYGFHRIMVLVSGADSERMDQLIAELGAKGVGFVLRQRPRKNFKSIDDHEATQFSERAVGEAMRLVLDRKPGKKALCASGGGITGLYYEIGALKCMDDCFSPGKLNSLDMYFGISSGAIISSLLAVGYSVDEIMASVAGEKGGRLPAFSLNLLRLAHVNRADLMNRIRQAIASGVKGIWQRTRKKSAFGIEDFFLEYSDLFGPPFHTHRFEKILEKIFLFPGAANRFADLSRPLFIGATDQDSRQHVLFGSEDCPVVTISKAIQASISINPAFASVKINDRYYMDGAVTKTTNFYAAIKRGANVIFLIDPFVPYISEKPGFNHDRGVFYNIDQDIRTITHKRFENTRNWLLRKHPEVSAYTFIPANNVRKIMSVNPMDHRPYMEIWKGAYISTLKRIVELRHRMRGDLLSHGISIDTDNAENVAARLEKTLSPCFADFFPERRIRIATPPLCLEN